MKKWRCLIYIDGENDDVYSWWQCEWRRNILGVLMMCIIERFCIDDYELLVMLWYLILDEFVLMHAYRVVSIFVFDVFTTMDYYYPYFNFVSDFF